MAMSTLKAIRLRWLKWFGWGLLGLVLSVLILIIGIRIAYQYAWTVVSSSTGINYRVISQSASLEPLKKVVESVAKKNGMQPFKSNEESLNYFFGWENSTGVFGDKKYQLSLRIDTYPKDEPDVRKRTVFVGLATIDAGKSDEWKKVARDIEVAIAPVGKVNSVDIGLDVAVYGSPRARMTCYTYPC